ncbi:hypothetical protein [Paenibacillus lemnae]|uniref:Uncharacterized protein n=1 Tax=Paenibacillus lemnae TaxID=1330551 RepID=A0A848MBN1_PAELE|nr:hypothetical protein [Paenibacillus lemnae]NMO97462.1 hypothetical protein [Paenibacillus lemnae]
MIIHKDVLDTIMKDYSRRIKEDDLELEELKGMFEVQAKLLGEYQKEMSSLEQHIRDLVKTHEEIVEFHKGIILEHDSMKEFIEDQNLKKEYQEHNVIRTLGMAQTLNQSKD